jgi:hypothetical protein
VFTILKQRANALILHELRGTRRTGSGQAPGSPAENPEILTNFDLLERRKASTEPCIGG